MQELVMANPFDFTPQSLRSVTSQAKLRDASRSLTLINLHAVNRILRRQVHSELV